jgi:hypothetical protein
MTNLFPPLYAGILSPELMSSYMTESKKTQLFFFADPILQGAVHGTRIPQKSDYVCLIATA